MIVLLSLFCDIFSEYTLTYNLQTINGILRVKSTFCNYTTDGVKVFFRNPISPSDLTVTKYRARSGYCEENILTHHNTVRSIRLNKFETVSFTQTFPIEFELFLREKLSVHMGKTLKRLPHNNSQFNINIHLCLNSFTVQDNTGIESIRSDTFIKYTIPKSLVSRVVIYYCGVDEPTGKSIISINILA